MPKTAVNFHKLKKGLYLKTTKGIPFSNKEESLAKSFHILQAYGEGLPELTNQIMKKAIKTKKS